MKFGCQIWILAITSSLFFEVSDVKATDTNSIKETEKIILRGLVKVDFNYGKTADSNLITYKLYTREDPDKIVILTEDNVESKNLAMDIKTILVIHGWARNDNSPWYQLLKKAYFQHGFYNIIYVNWATYGNASYGLSCSYVKPVGQLIARFLGKSGVPAKNIHLVGYSLGAQLAAFIGKAFEKEFGVKIGRITALDPAGPKWCSKYTKKEERLNESDATFVDVIHTDIQIFGYTNPCGHVDYYPNGGTDQPGCPEKQIEKTSGKNEHCNHRRSTWFFIESINKQVNASEIHFKENENYNIIITSKEEPRQVIFGEHINLHATGVYFLETNPTKPYLKPLPSNCSVAISEIK